MIRNLLILFLLTSAARSEKPNLIVILADDMGYSDASCFGGEIPTPALDQLANNGTRLTRFQNGGMCVISRASMLTGKWWPRALPEFKKTELLPEALKKQNYRTALIGKWHLAGHPMDHGFDHFFGFLNGFTDHFAGSASYRLDREAFSDFGPSYYSSDAFADRAIDFVSKKSDAPFFLYLSFQAPHNPLQAPKADILRHRGNYLGGWQATREARFARQKKLGLFPEEATLPPYPKNLPDWNTLSAEQKDLEDLRMATYAAMIERMDKGIGRLIDALKKSKQLDNTLILFLSDNGTDPFSVVDQTMLKRGLLPGDPGSNYQPGNGWAYASVTPWRLYKISQHGGGITTGAIAHWPKGIEKKGGIVHTPLHVIDILPGFLEATGTSLKSSGIPFFETLNGNFPRRKQSLYFQYMDNRAMRTHQWTLAAADGGKWELFDRQKDPFEINDLASEKPDLVNQLDRKWNLWWKRESGKSYIPKTTKQHRDYKPQGDRGTGRIYKPTAMPKKLSKRYPLPSKSH